MPIAQGGTTVGFQLGKHWSCLQVADAQWTPAKEYDVDWVVDHTPAMTVPDAMRPIADGIYAADETGVLIVPAAGKDRQVLSLLFRPLTARADAVQQKVAA